MFLFVIESVVRLSDGTADHWGRVEVYHEGQWGTVCKESFDIEDARVVCRSLNYKLVQQTNLFSIYCLHCL